MRISRPVRATFWAIVALALVFVYLPLGVVLLNSFSSSTSLAWPPSELTLQWWARAAVNAGAWEAVGTSAFVAACATAIALFLGTMCAIALDRFQFFGKEALNLLIVLPIALPGIVTGIVLNNLFRTGLGVQLGIGTLIMAHATFCIVTVYNNAFARMRRLNPNLADASSDLGADRFTTFRLVTLPQLRSALFAGALLAFGLSFDEIIVTQFTAGPGVTTLPIWIFQNMFRPGQAPIVNVVAVVLVVLSIVPIWIAQRLEARAATR